MEKRVIFNRSKILYAIGNQYYLMPVFDSHYEITRLVEVNSEGDYLYDEDGKTIKRDIPLVDFRRLAKVVNVKEEA